MVDANLKRFIFFYSIHVQIHDGKIEFFPLLHAVALEDEEDETAQ